MENSLSKIIDQVLVKSKRNKSAKDVGTDSRKTARRRFEYLFTKILRHDKEDFRRGGKNDPVKNPYVFPSRDVPFIEYVLRAVFDPLIEGDDDKLGSERIQDWLCGRLDTKLESNPVVVCELVDELRDLLLKAVLQAGAEEDCMRTWTDTVEMSLGYSVAAHIVEISKLMTDMKEILPVLDMDRFGKRNSMYHDGLEVRVYRPEKRPVSIEGKTVEQIVDEAETSDDVLDAVQQFVQKLHDSSRNRAMHMLEGILSLRPKGIKDEHAKRLMGRMYYATPRPYSIASPRLVFYRDVCHYLETHKDDLVALSEKTGMTEQEIIEWIQENIMYYRKA